MHDEQSGEHSGETSGENWHPPEREHRTLAVSTHIAVLAALSAVFLAVLGWQGSHLAREKGRNEGAEWQRDEFIRSLVTRDEFNRHLGRRWHEDAGNELTRLRGDVDTNTENIEGLAYDMERHHPFVTRSEGKAPKKDE